MTALAFAPTFDFDDDEQTEFKFSELSDRAKEHARNEYRYGDGLADEWWEFTYEDADAIARMMGIEIDRRMVRTHGGTKQEIAIGFSGFCSQGDGAHFEGIWTPVPDPHASLTAVMEHAPQDARLHEIALGLAYLSERCNALIPHASVKVKHSGPYQHSRWTDFEIDLPDPDTLDWENELQLMTWNALVRHHGLDYDNVEVEITSWLRALMDWIYRQLNDEYDWLMSDEAIDEALADDTFDEDGNIL